MVTDVDDPGDETGRSATFGRKKGDGHTTTPAAAESFEHEPAGSTTSTSTQFSPNVATPPTRHRSC
jgi:hypothetical protein